MYMRERRIPTIVGLLLIGLAVMIFRVAFDRISPIFTRASTTFAPKNVTITNVSDSTFTVTWITAEPASGAIRLDGALSKTTYFDERGTGQEKSTQPPPASYTTHSITVRNLKPEMTYTFQILSNGAIYQNEGKSYEVRTAGILPGVGTGIEPAYGQVTTPSGSAAEGVIVYLTLEGGQTISTLTKSSGTWVIPLNLVRSQDLTRYLPPSERINETVLIRSDQGEGSALTDTLNDNPVPVMTIGKTYDFRKIQADKKSLLAQAPEAVLGSSTEIRQNVSITKPADGSSLSSNLPLIQGTGVIGNQVLLTVGIDRPASDTVIVGSDGVWRYTPSRPLRDGRQSVTITSADIQNKTVAITHTFTILKSGTQVLGDATPSATLTPEPTIDETPTPTSTLAGEPIPETGFPLPLILLLMLGIGLLGGGSFVLIK